MKTTKKNAAASNDVPEVAENRESGTERIALAAVSDDPAYQEALNRPIERARLAMGLPNGSLAVTDASTIFEIYASVIEDCCDDPVIGLLDQVTRGLRFLDAALRVPSADQPLSDTDVMFHLHDLDRRMEALRQLYSRTIEALGAEVSK